MRKYLILRKKMIACAVVVAGGSLFQSNCINTVASLPICGGVLTFCSPADQLNALFPFLETPDYNSDPSCTIPLGCGGQPPDGSDLLPPAGGPGGVGSDPPEDDQGGGAAGGGGAGGGGGGGGGI